MEGEAGLGLHLGPGPELLEGGGVVGVPGAQALLGAEPGGEGEDALKGPDLLPLHHVALEAPSFLVPKALLGAVDPAPLVHHPHPPEPVSLWLGVDLLGEVHAEARGGVDLAAQDPGGPALPVEDPAQEPVVGLLGPGPELRQVEEVEEAYGEGQKDEGPEEGQGGDPRGVGRLELRAADEPRKPHQHGEDQP